MLGWDIGGANLKVVRCSSVGEERAFRSLSHPFEIQYALGQLSSTLASLAQHVGAGPGDLHAVTMTAELSQTFRFKREGVAAVIDALETAFPSQTLHVYTVEGEFVSPAEARQRPLSVAASNWTATARWVAQRFPTALLIDVGSTTTDVIPIVAGRVSATGKTDPERLASGELVYSGAVRTPVEAIVQQVPLWGQSAGVSAEVFALIGDVHVWLRRLRPEEYTAPTPDRRPATREYAGERLARVVCADRTMLADSDIDVIALEVARAQVQSIVRAVQQIRDRHPEIMTAVVTGLGEFVGSEAAKLAGLQVMSLPFEGVSPQATPAAAVALHLRTWTAQPA